MNSTEMLTATRVEVLNVLTYASTLECSYSEVIKPPKVGLYLKGVLNPVMVQGEQYFNVVTTDTRIDTVDKLSGRLINSRRQFESIPILPGQDISPMQGVIVDSNGNTVIPGYAMADKARYLTNYPTMPYRGVEIIRCMIEEFISRVTCHGWKINAESDLKALLYEEEGRNGMQLWRDGFMDRVIEPLIIRVMDFIGPDTFHIYFVKTREYEIIIEKTVDFRAWQWVKHQEECQEWSHRYDDV
jgi:hypothetical protein